MKLLLSGVALAALVALVAPGSAQAHRAYRMHHHHGWCCHYGWYGPWGWGPVHSPTDFVANQLNRAQLGGAVELNPQPLPPRR
jgi:hypothetical protein